MKSIGLTVNLDQATRYELPNGLVEYKIYSETTDHQWGRYMGIARETDKAYQIITHEMDMPYGGDILSGYRRPVAKSGWIPKSQLTKVTYTDMKTGQVVRVKYAIPSWLYNKTELYFIKVKTFKDLWKNRIKERV